MSAIPPSAPLPISATSRRLIVAAGHVGNNIFCTPAIQLLRSAQPNSVLDVVALNSACASVFVGNAAVDRVHVVRWVWQMSRLAAQYDEVICLHPKSAYLLQNATVPVRILPALNAQRHHAEQILEFAASLVGSTVEAGDCGYRVPARAMTLPVLKGRPCIGIHLGCGRTAIHGWKFFYRKRDSHPKLWPTENYIALAEQLRQTYPDALFVLTGTRNERFLARRFRKCMNDVVDLTGKTSVAELAGVIGELDLFITHDCGVLHIAASTSTPLLALFGPTNRVGTGPWPAAPHRQVLSAATMAALLPETVAAAAKAMLSAPKPVTITQPLREQSRLSVCNKLMLAGMAWLIESDVFEAGYFFSSVL